MPFIILDDVGTTARGQLRARHRLQVWERHRGICVICGERIDGVRERWIVEHVRALELGGADEFANMGPAHERCGWTKTQDDHQRTARAKRQKQRHLGITQALHPIPGSRLSPLKRKVDGTVVRRAAVEASAEAGPHRSQRRAVSAALHPQVEAHRRQEPPCQNRTAPTQRNKVRTERIGGDMPQTPAGPPAEAEASAELLPAVPHHLGFLFEERPLVQGENAEHYDALRDSLVQKIRPADVIEAIWVKDLVDLIWEARRLRRWRAQILDEARQEAARSFVDQAMAIWSGSVVMSLDSSPRADAAKIAQEWLSGRNKAKFKKLLDQQGLTIDHVAAQAFRLRLPEIERIDRMSAACDGRRDTLLREIERKRAALSQQMRAAAAHSVEVEARPVPGPNQVGPDGV